MELSTHSFQDLLVDIVDNRGRTCPTSEKGTPLIATNCIKDDSLYPIYENIRYVSDETLSTWFRGHPQPGDIIFVCKGSPGRVAWTPDPVPFCIAQDMVAIRPDTKIVHPKFLFALLRAKSTKEKILNMHVGTLIPHFKKGDFKNLYLDIPKDLDAQRYIGDIYFRLCERIELNIKLSKTIEAIAQALFKSWFVDFDPVIDNALAGGNPIPEPFQARAERRKQRLHEGQSDLQPMPAELRQLFPDAFVETKELGWVPEGWDVCSLGALVSVKRGGSPRPIHDFMAESGLPWVKISDATASKSRFLKETKGFIKKAGLEKTVFLKKGSLILSNSATPGLPKFLSLDACIHDGWLYFPEKTHLSDLFLYQLFLAIRPALLQQGNGSVFTNLKTDILKNHVIAKPACSIVQLFNSQLIPLHKKIHMLDAEKSTLEDLRDSLLPKLLSGQLRIPDIEALLDEAVA